PKPNWRRSCSVMTGASSAKRTELHPGRLHEVADHLPGPVLEGQRDDLPGGLQIGERALVRQDDVLTRGCVGYVGRVLRVRELPALERAELGPQGRRLLHPRVLRDRGLEMLARLFPGFLAF